MRTLPYHFGALALVFSMAGAASAQEPLEPPKNPIVDKSKPVPARLAGAPYYRQAGTPEQVGMPVAPGWSGFHAGNSPLTGSQGVWVARRADGTEPIGGNLVYSAPVSSGAAGVWANNSYSIPGFRPSVGAFVGPTIPSNATTPTTGGTVIQQVPVPQYVYIQPPAPPVPSVPPATAPSMAGTTPPTKPPGETKPPALADAKPTLPPSSRPADQVAARPSVSNESRPSMPFDNRAAFAPGGQDWELFDVSAYTARFGPSARPEESLDKLLRRELASLGAARDVNALQVTSKTVRVYDQPEVRQRVGDIVGSLVHYRPGRINGRATLFNVTDPARWRKVMLERIEGVSRRSRTGEMWSLRPADADLLVRTLAGSRVDEREFPASNGQESALYWPVDGNRRDGGLGRSRSLTNGVDADGLSLRFIPVVSWQDAASLIIHLDLLWRIDASRGQRGGLPDWRETRLEEKVFLPSGRFLLVSLGLVPNLDQGMKWNLFKARQAELLLLLELAPDRGNVIDGPSGATPAPAPFADPGPLARQDRFDDRFDDRSTSRRGDDRFRDIGGDPRDGYRSADPGRGGYEDRRGRYPDSGRSANDDDLLPPAPRGSSGRSTNTFGSNLADATRRAGETIRQPIDGFFRAINPATSTPVRRGSEPPEQLSSGGFSILR